MEQPAGTVAVPRKASTLLIVRDDPFEVLMLRRHSRGSFPSALVFPGGVMEEDDLHEGWLEHAQGAEDLEVEERAFRIAGIRETWEEASIMVAYDGSIASDAVAGADDVSFREFVAATDGKLQLDQIFYFGHWVTPDNLPKRWDTRFFLVAAPHNQVVQFDGNETVEAVWVNPVEALAMHESGERPIIFPTRMNLKRLAESASVAEAIAATEHHPRFQVMVRLQEQAGGMMGYIPVEAGYGNETNWIPAG